MDALLDESEKSKEEDVVLPLRKKRYTDSIDLHMKTMEMEYLNTAIYNEEYIKRFEEGLAQNIRIELDKRNWTLRELSYRCGLSYSHLSKMLKSSTGSCVSSIIVIAAAFHISPTELFPLEDSKRLTFGDKFDEITRVIDVKGKNFLLDFAVNYVKEYKRLNKCTK